MPKEKHPLTEEQLPEDRLPEKQPADAAAAPRPCASEEAAPSAPPAPEERSELDRLSDDFATLQDKYLRLAAEYDNFRRRSQRERETLYSEATAAAVLAFLPVVDNMDRAVSAACADAEYKKGAELTAQSLADVLSRLGVQPFGEVGDAFDPALHNAVLHEQDDGAEQSKIAEVFARGYRMGDRVLRCAMVKVVN